MVLYTFGIVEVLQRTAAMPVTERLRGRAAPIDNKRGVDDG